MFYHIHYRSLSICSLSLSLCLFHFCITFTSVSFYLCLLHILSLYLYFNESLFLLPSVILISFFLCTCHPLSLSFSIVCSFSILFFIKYMLVISLYSYPSTVQIIYYFPLFTLFLVLYTIMPDHILIYIRLYYVLHVQTYI